MSEDAYDALLREMIPNYEEFKAAAERLHLAEAKHLLETVQCEPVCGHDPLQFECRACEIAFWVAVKCKEMAGDEQAVREFSDKLSSEFSRLLKEGSRAGNSNGR